MLLMLSQPMIFILMMMSEDERFSSCCLMVDVDVSVSWFSSSPVGSLSFPAAQRLGFSLVEFQGDSRDPELGDFLLLSQQKRKQKQLTGETAFPSRRHHNVTGLHSVKAQTPQAHFLFCRSG